MKIHDIPKENRPRERLKLHGVEVLSDAELLAVLLQKGTKYENVVDMANRLISRHSFDKLCDCSLSELKEIKGIGDAKGMQILALFELSKRIKSGVIAEKVVNSSEDIAGYYMERMRGLKKEHLIAVFLDSKNKIINDKVISIGTLNSSLVHPREVFKSAIKESANSIILVHNHPSGDPAQSEEDEQITQKLNEVGKLLDIEILDHVIVGKDEFYSFKEGK
jgi:DNA repair protein RadC